ncbi:MAG: hypothetical protein FJ197_05075 [Gammaproteobacteria bacterium]|nr:hypothetical protein [Gammaproteobacteria bacterium]
MKRGCAIVLAIAAALAGCSNSDGRLAKPRPSVRAGEFGAADCFWNSSVSGFEVLDGRNLIVFASGRADAYHVQVGPGAQDLRFTSTLGFRSRGSRICGQAGEALVTQSFGSRGEELPIIGVYRLDEAAVGGLRQRFGRGDPPDSPEPQPGTGPDIDRDIEEQDRSREDETRQP